MNYAIGGDDELGNPEPCDPHCLPGLDDLAGHLVGAGSKKRREWLPPGGTKQTLAYAKQHGFDSPYLRVGADTDLAQAAPQHVTIKRWLDEIRIYGDPAVLAELGSQFSGQLMPAYRQLESWEEVFDERLKGMYAMGIEVAREREREQIGTDERSAAKVVGWSFIVLSMILYLVMFWYFPLRWGWSLFYYVLATLFCFGGLSVVFEDYEGARKLIDLPG